MKAHHHIGHLHAGVVDVVLHFHALAARTQHAHERIAQRGIAQMPDVRRLVGIDVGVLDDDLCRLSQPSSAAVGAAVPAHKSRASKRMLMYPLPATSSAATPGIEPSSGRQFRGDLARRLLQLFGQLEGGRHRQFAEVALLGLLDGDGKIDAIARLDVIVKGALNLFFEDVKHLREELRIENLLDGERAFGGEVALRQACSHAPRGCTALA